MISFVHCSDLHLGFAQYGEETRFADFGRVFADIIDYAICHQVDYFLIAGDLFNKRNINSRTLNQAITLLRRLRDAGISVIAIEGNHDKAPYGEQDSWMWFLNQQGYLHLLQPDFVDGCLTLTPYDHIRGSGSVLEFPGIRFVGLGYQGSMMPRRLQELSEQLEEFPGITVLLLHSALARMMHLGGIAWEDIAPLRSRVDYVAMGHIHRRYEEDGWIFNPGAPECWDLGESQAEKGFYHVIWPEESKAAQVRFIPSRRRLAKTITVEVASCQSPEEVYERCIGAAAQLALPAESGAMLRLTLQGSLPFNPLALDLAHIESKVRALTCCLVVEIENNCWAEQVSFSGSEGSQLSREVLERQVLAGLFAQDPHLKGAQSTLVDLALTLKEATASQADDAELARAIEELAQQLVAKEEAGLVAVQQGQAQTAAGIEVEGEKQD